MFCFKLCNGLICFLCDCVEILELQFLFLSFQFGFQFNMLRVMANLIQIHTHEFKERQILAQLFKTQMMMMMMLQCIGHSIQSR